MNRRVWVCVGLIFGVAIVTNRARGQDSLPAAAATAGLGSNIKSAINAESYVSDIRLFIRGEATQLQSGDFAAQSAARKKLVDECPGAGAVSPSYYAVYAREWAEIAKPLIAPESPLRLRLNVAIITARLAGNSPVNDPKVLALEPIADLALRDREGAVSLWGVEAARSMIPVLLQQPALLVSGNPTPVPAVTAAQLTANLVKTVKLHAKSSVEGYLALDVYHALVVRDIAGLTAAQVAPLQPPLVSPVLDVLEFRVSLYAKGAIPMPGAERDITTFLSSISYQSASPANQKRIREDLVNLITDAGQRAPLYTDPDDAAQLREMLKYASQALIVIAQYAGDQGAATALSWLANIPPSASAKDIETHSKSVWSVMELAFKDMPKPAPIPEMAPPPRPPAAPGAATPNPIGGPR